MEENTKISNGMEEAADIEREQENEYLFRSVESQSPLLSLSLLRLGSQPANTLTEGKAIGGKSCHDTIRLTKRKRDTTQEATNLHGKDRCSSIEARYKKMRANDYIHVSWCETE